MRSRLSIRTIALVGVLAATLTCAKMILSFLPNVEIVTLLCALYGYVFGPIGVGATIVFVCIEPLIYGFHLWVISYFLYWPLIPAIFWLLRRFGIKSRILLTSVALVLTLWFGVLSSLVEVGLFSGAYQNFFERFCIYYLRGITFYAIQFCCNAVAFPLLFRPVSDRLERMHRKST